MKNFKVLADFECTSIEDKSYGDLIDPQDVLHIGEETSRDILDGSEEADYRPEIVQATTQEQEEWMNAYTALTVEMRNAENATQKLINDFNQGIEKVRAVAEAAWSAYEPVQEEINRRVDLVDAAREAAAKATAERKDAEKESMLSEEDKLLGPRIFLITSKAQRNVDGPDMFKPVIHHIDCPTAKQLSWAGEPVRAEDAFAALMEGGASAYKPHYSWVADTQTEKRVPGSACERCSAFDLMRAHAPDTFMDWLERTERAEQPSIPKETWNGEMVLYKLMGAEYGGPRVKRSGCVRVPGADYRKLGRISEHEALVGWYEYGGPSVRGRMVAWPAQEMNEMIANLQDRKMVGRVVKTERDDLDQVGNLVIAVRKMTAWEIRQSKK